MGATDPRPRRSGRPPVANPTWAAGAAAAAALILAATLPATAQRVAGTVVADETGAPLQAAFVALTDTAGTRVAGALTGAHGRFILSAPAPGRYTLRVEMIGYRTVESPHLDLAADRLVRHDVRVPVDAVALDALSVSTRSSGCRLRPEEGEGLHRLWREARKALNVVAWAEREDRLRYDIETYTRRLSPVSLRVLREERDTLAGLTVGRPFRTLDPADLDREGYVRRGAMGSGLYSYYGPDAQVVLSDAFVERHCFWVETDAPDDRPWLGLAFRPREGRDVVDIEGVLWIDRESAELRVLEYRYTPLPRDIPPRHVGGRIEFERLPSGAWIIDRWWIRAPLPGSDRYGDRRLRELEESGAVVLQARTVEELAVLRGESRTAVITGTVYDSIRGGPLAGARVYLSGTQHAARTDDDGRFQLRAPAGSYALTFHHPVLDSLQLFPTPVDIELAAGDSVDITLATPGPQPPVSGGSATIGTKRTGSDASSSSPPGVFRSTRSDW